MSETNFKNGDVVYHKINYLKMVVTKDRLDEYINCVYINPAGNFIEHTFLKQELLNKLPDGKFAKSQMESHYVNDQKRG